MRCTIVTLFATLLVGCLAGCLSGCLGGGDPCESVGADTCHSLRQAALVETAIVESASTTTWYAVFAPLDADVELRISCTTDEALDSCVRDFNIPDLERLPRGEAEMTSGEVSTHGTGGTFRIAEVVQLQGGERHRFVGRVDELRFEQDGESVVFVAGEFDVVSSPVVVE